MNRITSLMLTFLAAVSCGTAYQPSAESELVNVGYGTLERKEVSTSVTRVDSKDVDNASMQNIFDYLEGRVPGLVINRTGDRSATLSIRGANSFYGSTEPLLVVDGTIVDDISEINPRDVKSVEVLKDGGAAIYGSRGANGVILITLKRN